MGKTMPPIILQLTAGLLATQGATVPVPIPVKQLPMSVQSMRIPQNSSDEPTTTQQAVKSGGMGSMSNQPYIYKHSGCTKDSSSGAFMEPLMPAASLGHATDNDSHMLLSDIKRKPDTSSKMKTFLPFKQPWGSDGKSLNGISAILFKVVNDNDDQSHGKDNEVSLMILGQDPDIIMDADSEPEQVSKAWQY